MTGFLITVVVLALSLLIIAKFIPIGVDIDNPLAALIAGAIIGVFNGIWSYFPNLIKIPLAILSLGLIPLIGSIIVFALAAWLVQGFRLRWGLWSAILGAIALSLINSLLFFILQSVGLVAVSA